MYKNSHCSTVDDRLETIWKSIGKALGKQITVHLAVKENETVLSVMIWN